MPQRSYVYPINMSIFKFFEVQNIPPKNKKNCHVKFLQNHFKFLRIIRLYFYVRRKHINPYPTAFPYGNGMVLHFYQQQESSTTKTVHKVINRGLKAYV